MDQALRLSAESLFDPKTPPDQIVFDVPYTNHEAIITTTLTYQLKHVSHTTQGGTSGNQSGRS